MAEFTPSWESGARAEIEKQERDLGYPNESDDVGSDYPRSTEEIDFEAVIGALRKNPDWRDKLLKLLDNDFGLSDEGKKNVMEDFDREVPPPSKPLFPGDRQGKGSDDQGAGADDYESIKKRLQKKYIPEDDEDMGMPNNSPLFR